MEAMAPAAVVAATEHYIRPVTGTTGNRIFRHQFTNRPIT